MQHWHVWQQLLKPKSSQPFLRLGRYLLLLSTHRIAFAHFIRHDLLGSSDKRLQLAGVLLLECIVNDPISADFIPDLSRVALQYRYVSSLVMYYAYCISNMLKQWRAYDIITIHSLQRRSQGITAWDPWLPIHKRPDTIDEKGKYIARQRKKRCTVFMEISLVSVVSIRCHCNCCLEINWQLVAISARYSNIHNLVSHLNYWAINLRSLQNMESIIQLALFQASHVQETTFNQKAIVKSEWSGRMNPTTFMIPCINKKLNTCAGA